MPPDLARIVVCPRFDLYRCSGCGHLQSAPPDPKIQKLIYEEYYSYYTVDTSESFAAPYRVPFRKFIDELIGTEAWPGGDLLEIGCSSGRQAEYFGRLVNQYTGIDPSSRISIAKETHPEFTFIKGYFPEAVGDKRFNIIVSQFNLEHIYDIGSFLKAVRNCLTTKGVFIAQLPDVGDFMRNGQPNFIAHEHMHYFTKPTLEHVLLHYGFRPIKWGLTGPSLIVAACSEEKRLTVDQSQIDSVIANATSHSELFARRPELPDVPILYYGVGPLLYWLLSEQPENSEYFVVDDNKAYEGQGLPGTTALIQRPNKELFRKMSTVVLSLNKIYHEKVLSKLTQYQLKMRIYHIDNSVWKVTEI